MEKNWKLIFPNALGEKKIQKKPLKEHLKEHYIKLDYFLEE